MKALIIIAICVFSVIAVYATEQQADRILYEGKERELLSNPLEDYYSNGRKRPRFMVEPLTTSSGNWRGYVATWQSINGQLYLTKIDGWLCSGGTKRSCRTVELTQVFPGKVRNGRVHATWFSGELRIPDGKQLQNVHIGYGSTYERDIIFSVKRGCVSGPIVVEHTIETLPSELAAARSELEKLKTSEDRKVKPSKEKAKRKPKSG